MFANKGLKQDVIIAGKSAGKKVSITPQAEPVYKEIRNLAKQGNYWAQITVNALHQLASGRLHQDNIFIKPGPVHRGGEEEFVMILPGCKVTVEKQSKDAFKIVYFEADAGYAELQQKENTPGIYEALYTREEVWTSVKSKAGKISPQKGRLVAVCNSGYPDPNKAARATAPKVASSHYSTETGESTLRKTNFDLHFTPGKKKIGGLINLKDARNPSAKSDIHASALLLSRAMYQSRKVDNVKWIAEYGGSAVLTQAMKILASQGVKLPKHSIFLYEPKTSQVEVLNAARAINVTIGRKLSRISPINLSAVFGQPAASVNRISNEKDYKIRRAIGDSVQMGALFTGGLTFAGAVAGYAGINIGVIAGTVGTAGAASIPALGVFLTAVSKAAPYIKEVNTFTKTVDTAAAHWAPRLHNQFKSKF
ncbi:hypothetical protein [Microbulbifer sp. YPW1]|uniref:hypothetical protein n=1 Tax=Microbulbifer sp. YPW1 TaxID=2745199 RepID=UPI00159B7235|nr:hypothetical protein [Microbulbifer sp. YPW1]QKX15814.1 hypothetical protein HUW35_01685 [Microbulbifer sp. YPW1]